MNKLRIVFMGTPDFALSTLRLLCESGHTPVAVYTQPDKVNRRGGKITFSPVKAYALEQGLPVHQPLTFRTEEAAAELATYRPDLIVVIAYGRILPQSILDIPTYGAVNIHASLLPKYRGAAPVQRAIINQEAESGVTLMHLDAGMDTGPIISQVKLPLTPDMTAGALLETLAGLGAKELLRILDRMPEALAEARPQDEEEATYAEKLTKDMGHLDWSRDALALHALARGMYPNPGTYTFFRGKRLKIHQTVLPAHPLPSGRPGEIVSLEEGVLWVAAGKGTLGIARLQPENSKQMRAADFINGHQVHIHDEMEN